MTATKTIEAALVLGLLCSLACASAAANLGDYVTPCKSKDPGLNECIRQAAQDLILKSAPGLPALGIPAMDPAKLGKLEVDRNGPLTMNLRFNTSTHEGLSGSKFKSASVDLKNHVYNFSVVIPRYVLSGEYDVSGKVILLPINGRGFANLTFIETEGEWSFTGKEEKRNGQTFLRLDKLHTRILENSPKRVYMYFDGLFGGNKQLGDTMNSIMNNNWKEITQLLKPSVNASFRRRIQPVAQQFIAGFPLNQLFTDL